MKKTLLTGLMRYLFSSLTALAFAILLILTPADVAMADSLSASDALDEILSYNILVQPQSDGSAIITYHVVWEVLDDSTEGALSWVRIGLPNRHYTDVTPLSYNISRFIRDGSRVNIYFDKNYYKGDVVTFEFSIHQHSLFDMDDSALTYEFTPGWFDEIAVDDINLIWAKTGVTGCTGFPETITQGDLYSYFSIPALYEIGLTSDSTASSEYYIWNDCLRAGETLTATLTYDRDSVNWQAERKYLMSQTAATVLYFFKVLARLLVFLTAIIVLYELLSGKSRYVNQSGVHYYHLTAGGTVADGPSKELREALGESKRKKDVSPSYIYVSHHVDHMYVPDPVEAPDLSGRTAGGYEINGRTSGGHNMPVRTAGGYEINGRTSGGHNMPGRTAGGHGITDRVAGGHTSKLSSRISAGYEHNSATGGGHSGGGGGGGCACACACACAGGGRAGCSRKDFYGTKLESRAVRAAIKKDMRYDLGYLDQCLFELAGSPIENVPMYRAVFKHPIDPVRLEEAVRSAMTSFPLFATQLEFDGKYYLRTNDRPLIILDCKESERPKTFGKNTNGYPWRIIYHDRDLCLEWIHGVTDGMGGLCFFKQILLSYFGHTPDTGFTADQIAPGVDPFCDPKEKGSGYSVDPTGFSVAHFPVKYKDYRSDCHSFYAETSEIVEAARNAHSSVAPVLVVLFSKALRMHLPENIRNRNVACNMAIDLRRSLNHQTMHNFVDMKRFTYTDSYDKMDFSEAARAYKEILDHARLTPNLIRSITGRIRSIKAYHIFPSRRWLHFALRIIGRFEKNMDCNFSISYPGKIELPPEITCEIENIDFKLWPDYGHGSIGALDYNGRFNFNICENYADDGVVADFVRLSEEQGIHWIQTDHSLFEQSHFEET